MNRNLRRFAIALAVLGLAGAGAVQLTKRTINLADFSEGVIEQPAKIAPIAGLAFSILPTATAVAPEGAMFEGGSWIRQRTISHSAVMICHPKGLVLFDTGLGKNIESQFGDFPLMTRLFFGYKKLTALADVLARDNPCPGRALTIIPSHLHWDHAGGIEDIPGAEVLVQLNERKQALSAGTAQGFLPSEIDAKSIKWRALVFTNKAYEQYRQSFDVFGDGSLVLVPMAGHTAGSVGLFLTMGDERSFFTGDTSWALEGITRPAHKFFAMRSKADLDPARLDGELAGIHRLMLRDPKLIVIPAHDTAAYPPGALYPNWSGR
jgi:glyoxylase-like metal-dependent hydrolase (beta-lactamase superfamily II)